MADTWLISCAELGHRANPAAAQRRPYPVSLKADHDRSLYRLTGDGLAFDAHPYNDGFKRTEIVQRERRVVFRNEIGIYAALF